MKLSRIIWVCLVLIGRAFAQRHPHVTELVRAGMAAAARGSLEESRTDFAAARRLAPADPEVDFREGLLLGQLGLEKEAAADFRKAIDARPDFAEAHYNLALSVIADPLARVDWPAAIEECRLALKARSNYPEALHLLGVALTNTGQTEEAAAQFQAALRLNPNSADDHFELGNGFESEGDRTRAQAQYRLALAARPVYPDAEIALAKLLIDNKQPEGAEAYLRSALKTNPDLAAAHYLLARALQLKSDATGAAIEFRQTKELTGRQADGVQSNRRSNEALDAARKGDPPSAERLLNEALKLKPDSAVAHYNLGLILADQGKYGEAERQIVEAISLAQAEARYYRELGRMAWREGKQEEARSAMQRAIDLDPNCELTSTDRRILAAGPDPKSVLDLGAKAETADAHFAFGRVLGQQNDWRGAAGEWLRALSLQPAHLDARNNLAVACAKLGDLNRADLQFRRMLFVKPDSAAAHFGIAVVALQRNDRVAAAAELKEVVRIEPSYPNAKRLLEQATAVGSSKN